MALFRRYKFSAFLWKDWEVEEALEKAEPALWRLSAIFAISLPVGPVAMIHKDYLHEVLQIFPNQNLILSRCESGFRRDFLGYVVNTACIHPEQD